jgi:hypothetical protein
MTALLLPLQWYDTACFVIVVAAVIASLWLLLQRLQRRRRHEHQRSLSVAAAGCSWRCAWRGLHPAALLLLRLAAALLLTGALMWDFHKYDATIFVYYTE